jgi:hypothetical protein
VYTFEDQDRPPRRERVEASSGAKARAKGAPVAASIHVMGLTGTLAPDQVFGAATAASPAKDRRSN